MNHETAVLLLSESLAGRLAPQEASAVDAHVASCAECREVVATMRLVREEVSAHGAALFEPHPSADDIPRYALADETLSTQDLARIGLHARACPTCQREIELTRRASARAGTWWQRPWALLAYPGACGHWMSLRPALAAVLVIAMIYPSYLGLVTLPETRGRSDHAAREIKSLRGEQEELRGSLQSAQERLRQSTNWGGGVRLLFLGGTRRDPARSLPAIRLAAGQPLQPILVDYDPTAGSGQALDRQIRISIRGAADGTETWAYEGRISEIWDPANQSISLLVPTSSLAPGEYRLELRGPGRRDPDYAARFRVEPAPTQ